MAQTHTTLFNLSDDAETLVVVKYTYSPGDPGRYYGKPEDCYPAEGAEVEIQSITKENGEAIIVAPQEQEKIVEWLAENHEEVDDREYEYDPPDRDDEDDDYFDRGEY